MPIIRRDNCIYATLRTCYSAWMTGIIIIIIIINRFYIYIYIIDGSSGSGRELWGMDGVGSG